MKKLISVTLLTAISSLAFASGEAITVYKDKNCGCCEGWIAHLREAGFQVKTVNMENMSSIKNRFAVPESMRSCHTAVLDKSGQVIEGHVPAAAINKLIARPNVKGVAAPGMPTNAPGMGKLDGNLVTYDFSGKSFSKD